MNATTKEIALIKYISTPGGYRDFINHLEQLGLLESFTAAMKGEERYEYGNAQRT